jgi:C4-type Zn-finger protein
MKCPSCGSNDIYSEEDEVDYGPPPLVMVAYYCRACGYGPGTKSVFEENNERAQRRVYGQRSDSP